MLVLSCKYKKYITLYSGLLLFDRLQSEIVRIQLVGWQNNDLGCIVFSLCSVEGFGEAFEKHIDCMHLKAAIRIKIGDGKR